MGRPARRWITDAMEAYVLGDEATWATLPPRLRAYIARWFENTGDAKHGAPFLKELNLRIEGHVPKVIMAELPVIEIVAMETPEIPPDARPVLSDGSPPEPEGTTLPGSNGHESSPEAGPLFLETPKRTDDTDLGEGQPGPDLGVDLAPDDPDTPEGGPGP